MIDKLRAAILLLAFASLMALMAGLGNAQTAAQEIGVVLGASGEVLQERESGAVAVKEYTVLSAGTTLRLAAGASVTLVQHKEGMTYSIRGPAIVKVLQATLAVEPASAIASKSTQTPPVEQQARGGASLRGDRADLRAGGENLGTSRAGLDAAVEKGNRRIEKEQGNDILMLLIFLVVIALIVVIGVALRKRRGALVSFLALLILISGAIYYATRKPDTEALMRALEVAKQSNEQLISARRDEAKVASELDLARKRANAEEIKQQEAELIAMAELVRQREAGAKAAVAMAEEAAKKAKDSEATKKADAEKRAVADKVAAERASADKAAADRRASAPPIASASKPAPEAPKSKSLSMGAAERLALKEEEAAKKHAAAGGEQLASVSPHLGDSSVSAKSAPSGLSLYQQGKAAEAAGNIKQAVRLYVRAIRAGEYEAAVALGDIFAEGKGDVAKDYGESLKYYALAERNGIKFERRVAR